VASRSSATDVARLVNDLESADAIRRAASVARLRVIGERAIPHLATFIESQSEARARALALSALQDQPAARALDIALGALDDSAADVVVGALAVLREWVVREEGTRALEAVTALAVDERREARVRAAAVDALADLPEHLVRPLRDRAPRSEDAWSSIDDPGAARAWVEAHGSTTAPATLHAVIERLHSSPETARIPIVVLTAKTMTDADRERLRGQIAYIAAKGGVDGPSLVRMVRSLAASEHSGETVTWPAH